MKSRDIIIIECPTNLGLSKLSETKEPGVGKLPQWLKKWGLHSAIAPSKVFQIPPPFYANVVDPVTQVRNVNEIIEFALTQSEVMRGASEGNNFVLVLGGDCSVLIGSGLVLKQMGRYGLFYLDGHTDYITPEQSHTHGAAGMDLGICCGLGHKKLTNILGIEPYFRQTDVFCVGNREYDDDYEKPINDSDVQYYPLQKLRRTGLKETVLNFLEMVKRSKLDGFFIHLDVDVLSNKVMPAVDSPQNGGLTYLELRQILSPLISSELAVGMEITILDPDLDPSGNYTVEFIKHIAPILKILL